MGATAASALSPDVLVAEAAKRAARRMGLPNRRDCPVDHVVVLMMENRSFDHYFGWLENADAMQHMTFADSDGNLHATRHHSDLGIGDASWQGCGFSDPGHGWDSGRKQMTDGFMADGTGNDVFALTYIDEGELGFIHDAAKAYTLYDRFHCSLMCSTWPNRYYMWSAQSGGIKNNTPPVQTLGNQWDTIFDLAGRRGVTARYYNSDCPSRPSGARAAPRGRARSPSTTPTARSGRCRTSPSSTRPSATAAASTATPPTSTRTATCASARPSRPTSSMPSWSRRATARARSSSSTTSGAASSITSPRRRSPTTARPPTSGR